MTIRVAWVSPVSSKSGVGTFSRSLSRYSRAVIEDETFEFWFLHPEATCKDPIHGEHSAFSPEQIGMLGLFDFVAYNVGNNTVHHRSIMEMLCQHPGLVVMHDYVYHHYFAECAVSRLGAPEAYASLSAVVEGQDYLASLDKSRALHRGATPIYGPWDSVEAPLNPLSAPIMRLATGLIVHSEYARGYCKEHFSGPILKLGMPCDQKATLSADEIERWADGLASKRLLQLSSFGHITRSKCLELVLEALSRSQALRASCRFVIAGFASDPDYLSELRKLVGVLALEDCVSFEIAIPEKKLTALMDQTDIFVNLRSPNTEGASVSLVEQLMSAKPVVVFASGCYAEVPDDGAYKIGVGGSVEELAELLGRVVEDREGIVRVGRRGREYAKGLDSRQYVERVCRFVIENRELLGRRNALFRNALTALHPAARGSLSVDNHVWLNELEASLFLLKLFDSGAVSAHPQPFRDSSDDELVLYVRSAILAVQPDVRLEARLRGLIDGLGRARFYRLICQLGWFIRNAFQTNGKTAGLALQAFDRLVPVLDQNIWALVELMPISVKAKLAIVGVHGRAAGDDAVQDFVDRLQRGDSFRHLLREHLESVLPDPSVIERADVAFGKWLGEAQASMEIDMRSRSMNLKENAYTPLSRANPSVGDALGSGFYGPEVSGVWTNRKAADLYFRALGAQPGARVTVVLHFNVGGTEFLEGREVTVSQIGEAGEVLGDVGETIRSDAAQALSLPVVVGSRGRFRMRVEVDQLFVPSRHSDSGDRRQLGAHLHAVKWFSS